MKTIKVLGLMSGTSLDGLDLALCHFWEVKGQWQFEIRQCDTISYQEDLYQQLKEAIYLTEAAHAQLHKTYGQWLGAQAKAFLAKHDLRVDFIASHGHTSHHRPAEGITFQLGDGQALANASGQKVVCDFRTLDVNLGGQGAPLVPIGDQLLLPEYGFCLNLGGISNISFQKGDQRIAYDVGLANMPLNYLTAQMGLPYDQGGQIAQSGQLLPAVLAPLNALAYYQLPYPKSTGIEWFSTKVKPILDTSGAAIKDLLHTVVHHNAQQLAKAILQENPPQGSKVLVTGGGAFNQFFIDCLNHYLQGQVALIIPPKKFIAFKEAMVFAFMGVLQQQGRTNVLATVTGAQKDSSSGVCFTPA